MVARYHQPGRRRSARHGRRGPPRGPPSGPVSASWRDIVAAEAPDPLTGMVRPQWLVTCSCGWGREGPSRWAAESVVKIVIFVTLLAFAGSTRGEEAMHDMWLAPDPPTRQEHRQL